MVETYVEEGSSMEEAVIAEKQAQDDDGARKEVTVAEMKLTEDCSQKLAKELKIAEDKKKSGAMVKQAAEHKSKWQEVKRLQVRSPIKPRELRFSDEESDLDYDEKLKLKILMGWLLTWTRRLVS